MIDFPDTPAVGDLFTLPDLKDYTWNGVAWQRGPLIDAPVLSSLSPTSFGVAETAATLTVNGQQLDNTTVVEVNGVDAFTSYVSTIQLTCVVDPSTLGVGSHGVTARKSGVNSNALSLAVQAPALVAIAPATTQSYLTTLTLTLTGTHFHSSSVVYAKGVAQPTTFVSTTQLTAIINPSVLTYGTWPVEVRAGTYTSSVVNLAVQMTPRVISTIPVTLTQKEPELVRVLGNEFSAGNQITVDGAAVTTAFVSITELTATVDAPYSPTLATDSQIAVNVAGSPLASQTITTIDHRCNIYDTYPDYWTEWTPVTNVEVWTNGYIRDGGSSVHMNGSPQNTWVNFNVAGTQMVVFFTFPWPSGGDQWVKLKVVNDGVHSSNEYDFWIEYIGAKKATLGIPIKEIR